MYIHICCIYTIIPCTGPSRCLSVVQPSPWCAPCLFLSDYWSGSLAKTNIKPLVLVVRLEFRLILALAIGRLILYYLAELAASPIARSI